MADASSDTVNYRAKSPLASKTVVFNVLGLIAMVLGSDQLKSLIGPNALEVVGSLLTVINLALRFGTVRPISPLLWDPTKSVPVAVKKLNK
jgi:hypothetical protein